MTTIRHGARGSAITKRENKAQRTADALYANNTLPDYEATRVRVLNEAVLCALCGEYVHRDNWQAHHDAYHSDTPTPSILTLDEYNAFQEHENTIAIYLRAFVEVGHALLDIKERDLYRESYPSFEAYCRDRWNFGRDYGYRLMTAATVADNLLTIVNTDELPANEAQARELVGLEPWQQQEVWRTLTETFETKVITASMTKAFADAMRGVIASGAVEDGDGSQVKVSELFKASVQEYAQERNERRKAHIEARTKSEKVTTIEGDIDDLIHQLSSLPSGKQYRVVIYANTEL